MRNLKFNDGTSFKLRYFHSPGIDPRRRMVVDKKWAKIVATELLNWMWLNQVYLDNRYSSEEYLYFYIPKFLTRKSEMSSFLSVISSSQYQSSLWLYLHRKLMSKFSPVIRLKVKRHKIYESEK